MQLFFGGGRGVGHGHVHEKDKKIIAGSATEGDILRKRGDSCGHTVNQEILTCRKH